MQRGKRHDLGKSLGYFQNIWFACDWHRLFIHHNLGFGQNQEATKLNVVILEEKAEAKPDPEHCPHRSINRVIDQWFCIECGSEFVPKNPKHRTKWPNQNCFRRS
jgi:hypothetical protein